MPPLASRHGLLPLVFQPVAHLGQQLLAVVLPMAQAMMVGSLGRSLLLRPQGRGPVGDRGSRRSRILARELATQATLPKTGCELAKLGIILDLCFMRGLCDLDSYGLLAG